MLSCLVLLTTEVEEGSVCGEVEMAVVVEIAGTVDVAVWKSRVISDQCNGSLHAAQKLYTAMVFS